MQAHERSWLEYADRVVRCPADHVAACEGAGGVGFSNGQPGRYPGFVGRRYLPSRGVLCLGLVHRLLPHLDDGPEGRFRPIEEAVTGWRAQPRSDQGDATFLASCQTAYEGSAPEWPYWQKHYAPLLDEGRLDVTQVAFANVAKCRTATEESSSASLRLARKCQAWIPVTAVIDALQPAAVLVASLQIELPDVGDVKVIQWNGRTRVNAEGLRPSTWVRRDGGWLRNLA